MWTPRFAFSGLIVCAAGLASAIQSSPDPTCSGGVSNAGVCCLKSCGSLCAVHGCGSAPGGANGCCGGTIRKDGRSCSTGSAPCVLGPAPPPPASCSLNPAIEYLGNDTIVRPAMSSPNVQSCCDNCSATRDCSFFTYDSMLQTCTLRSTNAPDTSKPNPNCTSGESHSAGPAPGPAPRPPPRVSVSVDGSVAVSHTGPNFVAWNIDASRNRGFFTRSLNVTEAFGARLAKQAAALSAEMIANESILRFGGSGNDYLTCKCFSHVSCVTLNLHWQRQMHLEAQNARHSQTPRSV